ncbi:hypothetical protein D9757_010688 [Collybiopsis confluens]|uniref:Uncharacterized protein n=1 Tax=Collybiopsis confluens TaxID=2823264 RepID=A0A8H5H9Q6_9AGAR|nr:hypothetical protein D9757_010688 [Collybiopsis confluens]
MHSWRSSFLLSALLLSPVVKCIQFTHNGSSTSSNSSVTFIWTREHNDPPKWLLASITSLNNTFISDLEIQHIPKSSGASGTVTVPITNSKSLNLTLGTFTFGFQKNHKAQFMGNLFGTLTTFEVVSSTRLVTPGILPQPVKDMLTPASKPNKTPIIVGAVLGSVGFLLVLVLLLLLYRRYHHRRHANRLLRDHRSFQSSRPAFPSYYSDEKRGSNSSWYSTTKELPAIPEISNALSSRAAAARVTSFDEGLVEIPAFPRNSIVPKRSLHAATVGFDPPKDRQRQLERAIARLHSQMNELQSTTDRNTAEGIQDEAGLVHLTLAMERLKRRLDQGG